MRNSPEDLETALKSAGFVKGSVGDIVGSLYATLLRSEEMLVTLTRLHPLVLDDASGALDQANDLAALDFGAICMQVLEMEDSPEKAHALGRLSGFAMWYANELRTP